MTASVAGTGAGGPARWARWGPRSARGVAATACGVVASLVLAGCGSAEPEEETNGLDGMEPAEIEEEARRAAAEADALRLSGNVVAGDIAFRLDMRLSEAGAMGEVSSENLYFELLRVEDDLYIKADAAFWQYQQSEGEGDSDAPEFDPAETLEDMYVVVAPEDPAYEQLSGFTDKSVLLDGLLALDGGREVGERGEIDGTETISLLGDQGAGGVLEVSLDGTPYPLRLARGGDAGEVRLAEWDKEFTVRAPQEDQIVDYGDQILTPEE